MTDISLGPLIVDDSTISYLDYCTKDEVEAWAGVDFSDGMGPTDAQLTTMISQASRMLDVYAGYQVAGTYTVTQYFDVNYRLEHIVLGRRPLQSVTTLHTIDDNGSETLLTQGRNRNNDDYWLSDSDAGIVRFNGRTFGSDSYYGNARNYIKVVYLAGNTSIPSEVKMAAILMVVRSAARATLNDENCLERVKEMWLKLLSSTEKELNQVLPYVQQNQPVAVAAFGNSGAYN